MGKNDIAVKQWLSAKDRFADLFNMLIFGGSTVVHPQDLEDMEGEADIFVPDKAGGESGIKRYRDIVKRWGNTATFAVMAVENQDKIHYAMPHKVMLYDGMDYETQIRNNWERFTEGRRQAKKTGQPLEHLTAGEYLSRFRRTDRLTPIISLVFYYGSEPWDGPVDLYDMFRLEGTEKEKAILEKYLPNYRINLVDAERLEEIERFSEDLQVILTMLKYRKDKDGLRNYVNENKKFFQKVDHETSQAMKAFLNMKQIPGETENEEEIINMCEAIQEMYDDGVRDGMKRGIQQGRDDLLKEKVKRKLQKQKSLEQIADELEEDVNVIRKIIKEVQ